MVMAADGVRFGIKTAPMHVGYPEILRVWREADGDPRITDAWLWDHLIPLAGPADGAALEAWTLLTALATQTVRLRFGVLVLSNRLRPPALLGKMASTLDVISGGRLVLGLGVGGTRQPPNTGGVGGPNPAIAEYAAYGYDLVAPGTGVRMLAETVQILRAMWTRPMFDHNGQFVTLRGNINEPKPVQAGGPPLLIGGWGERMLRLVAEVADVWNIPGPPHTSIDDALARCRRLDEICRDIGREPSSLGRSIQVTVDHERPAAVLDTVRRLAGGGFTHIVLNLPRPYPDRAVTRLADAVIDHV
jgi:alkanesulfonate monooxygenase SsuD/methylene tetrahydromethanopterin reductase-like flavin-dependent oxidoreductase (luciferase family)